MRHYALLFLLVTAGLGLACNDRPPENVPVDPTGPLCFALRSPASDASGAYSYHFVRLHRDVDDGVVGSFVIDTYQKDRQQGSLVGAFQAEENRFHVDASLMAEGSRYTEARSYRLEDDALLILGGVDGSETVATLPKVACSEYDAMYEAYQQGRLADLINTTDRSRLLKAEGLAEMGLTAEKLAEVPFMERNVELDNDFRTQEFLLYVMDPMICGTGGCTLLVVNESGETLSKISAVDLPVYALTATADEGAERAGSWNDLFAWSQGLRRLSAVEGRYPANASLQPPVLEAQMQRFPEYYALVLEHLE